MKGKLANGVGSQYSHTTLEPGVSSITNADAHTLAASSRLNWRPCLFKWTRPFRRNTKSGFCACAITFQTQSACSTPSLNLMIGTENIFEVLIFGPLLLLHMITQEQFNKYVQHKSLKLF